MEYKIDWDFISSLEGKGAKHGYVPSDNSGVTIATGFDLKEKDENLIIEYEDNGNGISEDVKQNVFEPFITTKRNAGGTGLGLNIVYNLVHQKLKGSLELISKENLGTKFIINIPKIYSTTENKK